MNQLDIGETSQPIHILASEPWNKTDIQLCAGVSYDFAATGMWKDGSIPACDADGYLTPSLLKLSEWMRRVPSERFFKLIGTIGQSMDAVLVIGTALDGFVPAISGPLFCFANDVRFMYWNNHDEVSLQITRTA